MSEIEKEGSLLVGSLLVPDGKMLKISPPVSKLHQCLLGMASDAFIQLLSL